MILSIIVVNWNTKALLLECLESVFKNPPRDAFELWVIDNASTDGSAAAVRELFPQANLIESVENLGFAGANNLGIKRSTGQWVLLLNSDTIVIPNTLQAMIDFMRGFPEAGAMGPKLLNPDETFQASYAKFPTLISEFLLFTGLSRYFIGPYAPSPSPYEGENAHTADWVSGAALVVRRDVINQIGGMDENYFLYSEETDWCWHIWKAGWQIWYDPNIRIIHRSGASTRQQSALNYARLYASKVRFFRRNYGYFTGFLLRALIVIVMSVRLILWQVALLFKQTNQRDSLRLRLEQERAALRTILKTANA